MADGDSTELRLALAMRGGVSLAVWIGGVCAEIDELLRAGRGGAAFWNDRLQESKFERVVVDVMAGASAGGLNGVLFASSIRFGFPMSRMRQIWNDVGDIDGLRRGKEPWTSVLDGDGVFLDQLVTQLSDLVSEPATHRVPSTLMDLRLSATMVEPVVMATIGPDDEELNRTRSSATFHFRYSDGVPVPSDDFSDGPGAIRRLALAARATASFPGAFEPAIVRSNRPRAFGARLPLVDGPLVDCGVVFSERSGSADNGLTAAPTDFLVADGGIVDNIPLGKAIEAVRTAPAEVPTERYLLYLHPTGPERVQATSPGDAPVVPIEKRRRVNVLWRGLQAARLAGETIEGDMRDLEAQRAGANLARVLRRQALRSLDGTPIQEAALRELPAYAVQRAVVGAAYVRRLLDDPIAVLGADRFPEPLHGGDYETPSDRWRAPLTRWPREARSELEAALAQAAAGPAKVDASVFRVGLGPLGRVTRLTIEWLRALERRTHGAPTLGQAKRRSYGLLWLLTTVLDPRRDLGWVVRAGVSPGSVTANQWSLETLRLLNLLLRAPQGLAADIVGGDESAVRAYMDASDGALGALMQPITRQELKDHLHQVGGSGSRVDLRNVILASLSRLVREVVEQTEPLPGGDHAELIDRVLRSSGRVEFRLARLEVLAFPEFLAGAIGGEPIEFRRISAAAPTPLAQDFEALAAATRAREGESTQKYCLAPDFKLAGNELSNFSAFFKKEWRDNDWLWGRLDAVPTLLDLLLPPGPNETPAARAPCGWRGELVKQRQQQIISEHFGIPLSDVKDFIKDYRTGLEKLDESSVPGVGESLHGLGATTAHVAVAFAPDSVRRYVIWPVTHVAGLVMRRVVRSRPQPGTGPATARLPLRRRLTRTVGPWAIALFVTLLAVSLAFGLADSKIAVAGGFVAGILVAPLPVLLLWRALRQPVPVPPRPSRPWPSERRARGERSVGATPDGAPKTNTPATGG